MRMDNSWFQRTAGMDVKDAVRKIVRERREQNGDPYDPRAKEILDEYVHEYMHEDEAPPGTWTADFEAAEKDARDATLLGMKE